MTVSGSANFIAGRESGAGCGLAQAPAQTRALGRSSRRLQNRRTSSPQKGQRQCSSIQTPLAVAPLLIDLSLGYNEANTSPILKAIVSRIGDLKFANA
jgi:hypothetical protein